MRSALRNVVAPRRCIASLCSRRLLCGITTIKRRTVGTAASGDNPLKQAEDVLRSTVEKELKEKLLRSLADGENARVRYQREVESARQYAVSKFAVAMLEVHDNLTRALDAKGNTSGLLEGVQITLRVLESIFEKHGIRKIDCEVGTRFDPKIHDAVLRVPPDNNEEGHSPNHIVQVLSDGYCLYDRVLRPVRVAIASNGGGSAADTAGISTSGNSSSDNSGPSSSSGSSW